MTSPIGSEEDPSMACEYRAKRIECLLAQHACGASVVINDGGKWSGSFRLIQNSMKREIATWKRDNIRRGQNKGRKQQREDQDATFRHS